MEDTIDDDLVAFNLEKRPPCPDPKAILRSKVRQLLHIALEIDRQQHPRFVWHFLRFGWNCCGLPRQEVTNVLGDALTLAFLYNL